MKLTLGLLIVLLFLNSDFFCQCPPTNPTTTISGLYSLDLSPAPGSVVYVTSTGTITGNINLTNSSLYNCGTILSQKIRMKQSVHNHQYILENNGSLKCDSVLLDSLGHIHNNDTMICNFLHLNVSSSFDQNYLLDAKNILVENDGKLNSVGSTKVDYFDMKDQGSWYYNHYGNISARKLFRVGVNAVVHGVVFICVDSCFINNGAIGSSTMPTWTPSIRVNGLSVNTGTINTIDFCDLSTTNGGMPDVNTGTISNVTYCTSQQFYCDFGYTFIKESKGLIKNILIYPNPTSTILNIRSDNYEFLSAEIEIVDYLGQTVLKSHYTDKISVETLPPGYYSLKILAASGQFHSTFIKQ